MRRTSVLILSGFIFLAGSTTVVRAQGDAYEQGLHAYLRKDYRTAVKHLKEYVDRKRDAKAYYLLGYANYELKRKSGAKGRRDFWGDTETAQYFKEAYRIDPDFSPRTSAFKR